VSAPSDLAPAGYALREAVPADAPEIARVLHLAFQEHEGKLDPPSGVHKETPESLAERMGKGGAVVVTADDGALVGAGFYEWRDDYAYIGRVGTLPAHRRAGLGTAILKAAEERARAKGYVRARLATRVHWAELRRYYESKGYRAVGYGTHPGKTLPTWVDLEKDLARAELAEAADLAREGFRVGALDHVQLAIPRGKEDEARAFWIGVLGFTEIPKAEGSSGRGGAWFAVGPVQVHVGVEDDFRPARKAHPALRVHGLEALRARLTAAGRPIEPLPALEGHPRFHSSDSFGNRIEFIAETA
jgi:GNAT superfamily N-acetyltransferase